MLIIYDEIRSCRCGSRNTHISFFHHFFFFNVALQHLGPIDQNYVLFVGFLIFEFRLHEICLICLAHFVKLYYKRHCFFNFEFSDFFFQNSMGFQCIFELTF